MSENPYAPPRAPIQPAATPGGGGSVESALRGDYDLSISAVMSEAWERSKGAKATLIGAVILAYVINFGASLVLQAPLLLLGESDEAVGLVTLLSVVVPLILLPLTAPLYAGLMMLGVRRAAGQPIAVGELFAHFGKVVPLVIFSIVSMILVFAGFLLLILPGIYLAIAYTCAVPLIVDKGMGPWQALETSRRALTHKWLGVFGLLVAVMIVFLLSIIPLGLGLIWAGPWALICMGVLYHRVFGVSSTV